MNITLTNQDTTNFRAAAGGSITLVSHGGLAGPAHKVATNDSLCMAPATGLIGHVLAEKQKGLKPNDELSDQNLPARPNRCT